MQQASGSRIPILPVWAKNVPTLEVSEGPKYSHADELMVGTGLKIKKAEGLMKCDIVDRMRSLGMPVSERIF